MDVSVGHTHSFQSGLDVAPSGACQQDTQVVVVPKLFNHLKEDIWSLDPFGRQSFTRSIPVSLKGTDAKCCQRNFQLTTNVVTLLGGRGTEELNVYTVRDPY